MSRHPISDDHEGDDLREQLYRVLLRLVRRQQRDSTAIRGLSTILKHLEAAGSGAGDAETNLRRAAQALAELEGTTL